MLFLLLAVARRSFMRRKIGVELSSASPDAVMPFTVHHCTNSAYSKKPSRLSSRMAKQSRNSSGVWLARHHGLGVVVRIARAAGLCGRGQHGAHQSDNMVTPRHPQPKLRKNKAIHGLTKSWPYSFAKLLNSVGLSLASKSASKLSNSALIAASSSSGMTHCDGGGGVRQRK